jgi:hypothetical protein
MSLLDELLALIAVVIPLLLVVVPISGFPAVAAMMARKRGGSPLLWAVLTFVVCLFTLPFGLPVLVTAGVAMVLAATYAGKRDKPCPHCRKMIPKDSIACPFCAGDPRTGLDVV